MRTFVISLSKDNQKRRDHIRAQFNAKGLSFEFFNAITPIDNDHLLQKYNLTGRKTELTEGATSCLLSHYSLWEKMIDENIPYIAIFEDDVHIGDDINFFLNDFEWNSVEFDIIKLEKAMPEQVYTTFRPINRIKDRGLFRLKSKHYGMAGYIVSQRGAKYLIDAYANTKELVTVDKFVFEELLNKKEYIVLQMIPAISIQDVVLNQTNDNFPSSLPPPEYDTEAAFVSKNKTSLLKKIIRELKRPFLQLKSKIDKLLFIKNIYFK